MKEELATVRGKESEVNHRKSDLEKQLEVMVMVMVMVMLMLMLMLMLIISTGQILSHHKLPQPLE